MNHNDDHNIVDEMGDTALHRAARNGDTRLTKLLLDNHAFVDPLNNDGSTPLHLAIRKGYYNVAEILLGYFADPNIQDNDGKSAGHHLAYISAMATVTAEFRDLIFPRMNLQLADLSGDTVLDCFRATLQRQTGQHDEKSIEFEAARWVCLNCKKHSTTLLRCKRCRRARYCDKTCQSAHWNAGHMKECSIGIRMMNACKDENQFAQLLRHYCETGDSDGVELMIDHGVDINDTRYYVLRNSPLHYSRHYWVSKVLIDNGADITAINDEGLDPLLEFVRETNTLMTGGCAEHCCAGQKKNCFLAARAFAVTSLLVKNGANIDLYSSLLAKRGATALHNDNIVSLDEFYKNPAFFHRFLLIRKNAINDICKTLLDSWPVLCQTNANEIAEFMYGRDVLKGKDDHPGYCFGCKKKRSNLKRCAACSQIWYCSRKCQTDSWTFHKPTCLYLKQIQGL